MEVILYSTHCPQCVLLETKLKKANIAYKEINDQELMIQKGFKSVPMLEIDGKIYSYSSDTDKKSVDQLIEQLKDGN